MPDEEKLKEEILKRGGSYRLELTPALFRQLTERIEKLPTEGNIKLKELPKTARLHIREDLKGRRERAIWAGDELLPIIGEVETLQEEMEGWVEAQGDTGFAKTAQFAEVQQTVRELKGISKKLNDAREELLAVIFPGWRDALDAEERKTNEQRNKRRSSIY